MILGQSQTAGVAGFRSQCLNLVRIPGRKGSRRLDRGLAERQRRNGVPPCLGPFLFVLKPLVSANRSGTRRRKSSSVELGRAPSSPFAEVSQS